jgi:hypothetical protein
MIRVVIIVCICIASAAIGGTRIHDIYAPTEIPAGDDFIVTVAISPMDKGNNRVIVIEHPTQCSLKTVYAVSPKDPTTLLALSTDSEVGGMFAREKGRSVASFRDESEVYAGEANLIVYYFVFSSTDEIPNGVFKCALVERNDPFFKQEPVKDKKGKKKPKAINPNWRMVNPPRGSDFRFTSFSESHTLEVQFVTGWEDNSRALLMKGKKSSAALRIPKDSLAQILWRDFSLGFWYRSVEPFQDLFSIIRGEDTIKGYIDGYGQVTVSSFDEGVEEMLLQSPYLNDGAWHHCLLSKDSVSVWRLFIDGEFIEKKHFADLALPTNSHILLGSSSAENNILFDEFIVLSRAMNAKSDVAPYITTAARDTLSDAYAIFHFDEYGRAPRSSVFERETDSASGKIRLRPITMSIDTNASLVESSSPVLFEESVLLLERPSPAKLNFIWRTSREYNVRSYQLERRVATFGEYQTVLRIPAKKYISPKDTDASQLGRMLYSASETLPKISKDIDLYYRLGLVAEDSSVRYTSPLKIEYGDARDVFLEQNKPNPFNTKTSISYMLKKPGWLKLAIYDIIGREVLLLNDGKTDAGKHTIEIDATDWPAGIYFYKAKFGKQTVTKRMLIIK